MRTPERHRLEGPIETIGVVYREHTPEVLTIVDRLTSWAEDREIRTMVEEYEGNGERPSLDLDEHAVDLVVALGGDGTFLRASRLAVGTDTPVLGVNIGRLGFLTAIPDSNLEGGLERVVSGEAILEYRFRLRAAIERDGEVKEAGFFALNDVVVHTSGAARVTPLALSVANADGEGEREEVGSFAADGVIVSTPTGSTAYSMSAGGPIITPDVEAIVVTPICPHSLAVRPLVLPAHQTIHVGALEDGAEHQLTVDGQVVRGLDPGERVVVAREEERPLPLVRLPGQTFFKTMRKKLNWAARPPERA
ncbi:MAG: NAD(+)/NADH kinase [Longimicrobiales bacterium]|nr:NAD(+)/NADH kinase [Longimicrobiales bacterium]